MFGICRAWIPALSLAATTPGLVGCRATAPGRIVADDFGDQSQLVIMADWDDVEGSVAVALGQAEVASDGLETSEDSYTYRLRSVGAIPGTLWITRAPGAPPDKPIPVTLRCRFGHFRDAADRQRERRVIDRVAARLRDLAGRDYAPIR
jgi:hypothetical protein